MKKILLVMILSVLTITNANAFCENGDIYQGADNTQYCVSPDGFMMNFWTAFSWCESQGGTLASLEQACGTGIDIFGDACLNIKNGSFKTNTTRSNNIRLWTSTPANYSTALSDVVNMYDGFICFAGNCWGGRDSSNYVLCVAGSS